MDGRVAASGWRVRIRIVPQQTGARHREWLAAPQAIRDAHPIDALDEYYRARRLVNGSSRAEHDRPRIFVHARRKPAAV